MVRESRKRRALAGINCTDASGFLQAPGRSPLQATLRVLATLSVISLVGSCGESHIAAGLGLAWPTPASISYGAKLGPAQLNATANVPGTFAYTPAAGAILSAGNQLLSVTFTPSDSARYQAASATVLLTVTKATPVITWNPPQPITYGTPLTSAQLSANVASIDGVLTYTPGPGAVLSAGAQTLTAAFSPADTTNYQPARATVTFTVNKATPVICWPKPVPIPSGTALSAMQLDAVATGVAGTFSYSPSTGTVPGVGSQVITAKYTPTDTRNYDVVMASQTLTVIDAASPVIVSQPQDQSVAQGQSATFSVVATAQTPLSYQWLKNSVYINGATSPSFTTQPTKIADNGALYSVVVSDSGHRITSAAAKLVVSMPAVSSYFVAPGGNDLADGSELLPFATLARAQLAMQSSTTKVTQIENGTYYLGSPLVLTEADNGETWEAAPGANVVLSGGQIITGWRSEGNGIYSAAASQPVGVDLTIAGLRQLPADLGYDPDQPYTSGWRVIASTGAQGVSSTFAVLPADLTASVKPGALIQLIDHCRWSDIFTRIVSVDPGAGTITVADGFDVGTMAGLAGSWRVLDDPADISQAGQFAYDAQNSRVYVAPASSESLGSDTVVAARLGTLISIQNASGITISGLGFSDTTSDTVQPSGLWDDSPAAIMADNLRASIISGNTFTNVGNGIVLRGSSNDALIGNTFTQIGVSGISLQSNDTENTIASNILKDIGQTNVFSYGISIRDSSNNLIDSNLIDGVGRWGIVLGPSGVPSDLGFSNTGNVLANNIIRNTSNRTNDTGAIYGVAQTQNGYLNADLLITGNRIENVGGLVRNISGAYGAGFAQGIYMDDHLSGVTITNNVIESGGVYGVVLCHGCSGNSANNNVVILQPAPIYDRGLYGSSFATGDMAYNGTTWIDLLPSYFPDDVGISTIVVQLSGKSFGSTSPTFQLQVDGSTVGTGTAASAVSDFAFKLALVPRQVHRIGITLTGGADTGTGTTSLHNLALLVNNTAVSMIAPEATGTDGADGFAVIPDDLEVTDFSVFRNIIYRNGGLSQDVYDLAPFCNPSYVDPNPGVIDTNVLYQNVSGAVDTLFGERKLDTDSLFADPLFTNPATGDYRLQTGSPALQIGFAVPGVPLGP